MTATEILLNVLVVFILFNILNSVPVVSYSKYGGHAKNYSVDVIVNVITHSPSWVSNNNRKYQAARQIYTC